LLHARYERLVAAALWVESTRVEPGLVDHKRGNGVGLAPGPRRKEIADDLRAGGLGVAFAPDEPTLLWEKLAFLAPLALTTTALGGPVGAVQTDPTWNQRLLDCHDETVAVAVAEGATLDAATLRNRFDFPGGDMKTSMQKDFDAGRPLELDAIAGPVARGGRRHGIATPATDELVRLVEERLADC
jgi:2-dehydropantoate 2-reductase